MSRNSALALLRIPWDSQIVPRRINFEVDDETYRRARVLAAEADTSVSGALRVLLRLWNADETIQRRVRAEADPVRRKSRVGSDG